MKTIVALSAALLAYPACACSSNSSSNAAEGKDAKPAAKAAGESPKAASIEAPPDVAAVPSDAQKSASGLAWKVLTPGTGKEKPSAEDTVQVHYTGWTTDGKSFDSSVSRGQPATFPLNRVIKGWTEGVQLMTVGEKRRFWIPAELAYGSTPTRPGAPSGMLVFDIELLEIKSAPKVPEDVAAVPTDAKKSASGLAWKVLQPGTGKDKPAATDKVSVHYSGWSTDGKMFDSSVARGRPATFPLNGVIKGWTEGVQLMTVGEKRRFWIPGDLAYGDTPKRPGAPSGMLVFDIELLEIVKPPKVPEDVAAPPANAKKTKSGISYRVLTPGTGSEHPSAESQVRVHYTGWMTDGKMFDSSLTRGQPATFGLNRVIKGWTEGVQLMVVGEKTRFWIPAELAYGETPRRPGGPSGMLVFDIELIEIL